MWVDVHVGLIQAPWLAQRPFSDHVVLCTSGDEREQEGKAEQHVIRARAEQHVIRARGPWVGVG